HPTSVHQRRAENVVRGAITSPLIRERSARHLESSDGLLSEIATHWHLMLCAGSLKTILRGAQMEWPPNAPLLFAGGGPPHGCHCPFPIVQVHDNRRIGRRQ